MAQRERVRGWILPYLPVLSFRMNQSHPEKAERGIEGKRYPVEFMYVDDMGDYQLIPHVKEWYHQELQKAREEERERIEAIFKEHIPPHAMDLEDSVWLKRLLNKA